MDEMQKLYDAKEYDQVVELLLKAVTQPSQKPMVGIFCLIIKLKFFCLFSSVNWKMHKMERNCLFITSIFGLLLWNGSYF